MMNKLLSELGINYPKLLRHKEVWRWCIILYSLLINGRLPLKTTSLVVSSNVSIKQDESIFKLLNIGALAYADDLVILFEKN